MTKNHFYLHIECFSYIINEKYQYIFQIFWIICLVEHTKYHFIKIPDENSDWSGCSWGQISKEGINLLWITGKLQTWAQAFSLVLPFLDVYFLDWKYKNTKVEKQYILLGIKAKYLPRNVQYQIEGQTLKFNGLTLSGLCSRERNNQ